MTESAFGVNADDSDATPAIARVANNEPTPEMGCEIAENLRALIDRMDRRHPDLKQIAARRLEGDTVQEIADQLDSPKRTIERRLAWIEEIWNEYREELN